MRRIAVLRPEPGASATMRRARDRGLEAFALPLFELRPIDWSPPAENFDGLLLTSANAVRLAGDQLRQVAALPVHAVGRSTAKAAEAAGLQVQTAGSGGVDALLDQLPDGIRLLHLCGEERHEPIDPRQAITPVPVYTSAPLPGPDLVPLRGAIALVHSPRAASRLAELVSDRDDITIAAISPAVAHAAGEGWEQVEAATQPDDAALLSLAARMCQESGS